MAEQDDRGDGNPPSAKRRAGTDARLEAPG
jgi:hypothetical protein